MVLELIKNPIVLGIIIATIAYIYLDWKRSKKLKKKDKDINLLIPLIIGCISSLIFYFIFNNMAQVVQLPTTPDFIAQPQMMPNTAPMKLNLNMSDEQNQSFHLVGRNITIPHNIPDIVNL
jgi:hypothetical protein